MDLTGPISVPTWDGFLYALVIIEVSCHYPVGRLLHNKDETSTTVRDILVMSERQSGQKIRRLCSDNGSEFINQTMAKFCCCNGIVHEPTIPYTPEQNSIAERAIAIFFEIVWSMLYMAGISLCYWGEAFTYAVHIWTLCSTTALNGIVPYKAWTGHKPDVSHLHVFGLLGWAHVPKQVRKGKLESQAVKVRILGWWVDESKGYHLEDLENSKLIASQDVHLFKDSSPSELATIDIDTLPINAVNKLVDNAIAKECTNLPAQSTLSPPDAPVVSSMTDVTTTEASKPNKTIKDQPAPPLYRSSRERKPTNHYALLSVDDTVTNGGLNVTFVAIAGEPKTYLEAMQSTHSKQWELAVCAEFA